MRNKWRWVGVPILLLLMLFVAAATFLQADLLAAPDVLLILGTWVAIATVIAVARIDKPFVRSHQLTTWIGRRFGRGPRGIALTASVLLTILRGVAIYLLGLNENTENVRWAMRMTLDIRTEHTER